MKELIPVDLEEVRRYWHSVLCLEANSMATKIGGDFKVVGNKIIKDENATEKRLDVSARLQRRKSKKVTVKKPVVRDFRP